MEIQRFTKSPSSKNSWSSGEKISKPKVITKFIKCDNRIELKVEEEELLFLRVVQVSEKD